MKISTAQEAINGNSNDTVITPLRLKQVLNSKNIGGGNSGGITKETDPIFTSSPAASITDEDIENWNNPPIPDVPDEVQFGGSVAKEGADIWIKILRNLFNPETINTTSASFNSSGLEMNDFYYWGVSDYIEIEPNTDYTLSGITYGSVNRYHCWYDADKKLISTFPRFINTIKSQTYKSPSNAKYIRFSLFLGAEDNAAVDERTTFQFEKGSSASPYIPYSEGESEILVRDADGTFKNLYELFPPDCDNESIIEETDPTVPDYVKQITQEEIDKWNSGTGGGSGDNIDIDDITSKMSKVLYDNPDGTSTTVQLTETYNNFKYLEIFCKATDNTYAYTRIENPVDGKRATVMGGWFGTNAYFKNCVLVLSDGDKINVTQGNNAQITGTNACSTASMEDAMKVVKVVGYYDENVLIVGNNGTEIVNTNRPKNIMTLYLDATVNCVSQVYTHLDLSLYNSNGDKLTYENGYVKIGKDISKVKVSAAAIYEVSTSGAQHIHIDKNDVAVAWNYGAAMESGQNVTAIISPVVIDVKEGDLIDLKYYSSASNNKVGGHYTNMTYLTVEAVEDGQIITVNNTIDGIPIGSEFEYDGEEVPDGYEEVSVEDDIVDTYSTEETKTNKIWIDGKPIYRKVYQYTTAAGANPVQFSEIGITDIDTIVDISGFTRQPSSNNYVPLSYYNSSTDWANYYTGGNNAFSVRCGSSYGFGATTIIFEYTKTTD